jgi:thioredoxin 1
MTAGSNPRQFLSGNRANELFSQRSLAGSSSSMGRCTVVCSATAGEEEVKEGWWTKDLPANFKHVKTVQELVDALDTAAQNDQLLVLEVFAPWCGACKSLFHKLKKFCVCYDDVQFVALNFEDNRKLARGLGIKVLPYFHFYRGADGRVGSMTASVTKAKLLKEAIELHRAPRCFISDNGDMYLPEYPSVHPSGSGHTSDEDAAKESAMA